jgi:uncharacterized LabA/DUF88 family protein
MSKYAFVDGPALASFIETSVGRLIAKPKGAFHYGSFFARNSFGCSRIFYYDAYPRKKDNETQNEFTTRYQEKERFLAGLNQLNYFHVRTGTVRHRKRGAGSMEQKGVDIQLALDVYQHAIRDNITEAILVTSDLDFYPLLEALTQTKTTTKLRYDLEKTSAELIQVADVAQPLTLQECLNGFVGHDVHQSTFVNKPHERCTCLITQTFLDGSLGLYTDGAWFYVHYDQDEHTYLCEEPAVGIDCIERDYGKRLSAADLQAVNAAAAKVPLTGPAK